MRIEGETMTVEEGIEVIETGQYCEREDITVIVLPKSVRHIGDYAFAGCKNLTHIELEEGVTEIGECAFAGCASLPKIDIPQSTRLIGTEAFANCSELRQVTLPRFFDSLSPTLFLGCTKLEDVAIGDFYETDGQFIWGKEGKELIIALPSLRDTELTIPEGITEIKTNALALNSHINRLTLPSSLDRIDGDSIAGMRQLCEILTKEGSKFHSQNGLLTRDDVLVLCPPSHRDKNIKIDKTIKRIGKGAFRSCNGIETVFLPKSCENFAIDDLAFAECANLTEAQGAAKYIGDRAFANCRKLSTIPIGENTEKIGDEAFEGCEALRSVAIPSGLQTISQGAFADCSNLSEIDFHDDIEKIESQAFIGCGKLEKADLPLNLKVIGYGAFAWSGLKAVALPCEIEDVEDFAFGMCKKLEVATLPNRLFDKAERIFAGSNKLQLMGPNDKQR